MTNQTTKHCPHCWKEIDVNSLYCNYCGKKQELTTPEKEIKKDVTSKIYNGILIGIIVFIVGIIATGAILDWHTNKIKAEKNVSATSQKTVAKSDADTSSVVYITEYGEKYHKKTCRYITESNRIQTTVNKAKKRGYTACSVCNPK